MTPPAPCPITAEVERLAEALALKLFEAMKEDLYWRARDKARLKRFVEPREYFKVCDLASDVFEYVPRDTAC